MTVITPDQLDTLDDEQTIVVLTSHRFRRPITKVYRRSVGSSYWTHQDPEDRYDGETKYSARQLVAIAERDSCAISAADGTSRIAALGELVALPAKALILTGEPVYPTLFQFYDRGHISDLDPSDHYDGEYDITAEQLWGAFGEAGLFAAWTPDEVPAPADQEGPKAKKR